MAIRDTLPPSLDALFKGSTEKQAATAATPKPTPDIKYQHDPIGFMVDVLGMEHRTLEWSLDPAYDRHIWDGTHDPFVVAADALAKGNDVGIESGTGVGKTIFAAGVALWFSACFEDSLVVTTAPIHDQLTLQLWKEIGKFWPRYSARYPWASTVELRVRHRPGDGPQKEVWAIIGYACGVEAMSESAVRAQGFHAAHMLHITEETPGINPATMTAMLNTRGGEHNVQLSVGNPDHRDDALHQFCTMAGVTHVRISSFDHPNIVCKADVIPGAISPKGIRKLDAKWGKGSAMYESRVRGISPPQAAQALIRREWCDRAVARYEMWQNLPGARRAKGVDVAQSLNGDKAAIADWNGPCLLEVRSFPCPNATELGRTVHAEMERDGVEARYVGIDPVGVGAATTNHLNDATGYQVQALNGGARPARDTIRGDADDAGKPYWSSWMPDANAFANLRSQIHWQMREDLRLDRIALPPNEDLIRQLTSPTYVVKNGKTIVESKDAIRQRAGGKSPDEADAVMYGNWVRYRNTEKPEEVERVFGAFDPDVLLAEVERTRRVRRPKPSTLWEDRPIDPVWGAVY